ISLDVLPEQLLDNRYCRALLTTLSGHSMRPSQLTLELGASELDRRRGGGCGYFETLMRTGVNISVRGLGVLEFDRLALLGGRLNEWKLSRHAYQCLTQRGMCLSSVRSLLSRHQMGPVRITATGIDSYAAYRELQSQGFDLAQGSYFCGPMAGDA